MATLIYAGIGALATPAKVLADMTVISQWLARTGWHLSSGGAGDLPPSTGPMLLGAPYRIMSRAVV